MAKSAIKVDTIEKLAEVVKKGFVSVEKRFDKTDQLIEKLAALTVEEFADADIRFGGLESEVRSGFDELQRTLDKQDTRISGTENILLHTSRKTNRA